MEKPSFFEMTPIDLRSQLLKKYPMIPNSKTCSCSKTQCLKKYCECLSNNQYCYNCNCVDCHNNAKFLSNRINGDNQVLICTCSRSNCNKKYCECYKAGKVCNINCRCINCFNQTEFFKENNETQAKEREHVQVKPVLLERILQHQDHNQEPFPILLES